MAALDFCALVLLLAGVPILWDSSLLLNPDAEPLSKGWDSAPRDLQKNGFFVDILGKKA